MKNEDISNLVKTKNNIEKNYSSLEVTILSSDDIIGDNNLDIFYRIGTKCAITDFALLLGAFASTSFHVPKDRSLKGRTCWWYTRSIASTGEIYVIDSNGDLGRAPNSSIDQGGIRPVLIYDYRNSSFKTVEENGNMILVEYGEYPQYAVEESLQKELETRLDKKLLKRTWKAYRTEESRTLYRRSSNLIEEDSDERINVTSFDEYTYKGRKYVRVLANCLNGECKLSNNSIVHTGDIVWVEVLPIRWYYDVDRDILISKLSLISGISYGKTLEKGYASGGKVYFDISQLKDYYDKYNSFSFKNTKMYKFLNNYFIKDIIPSEINTYEDRLDIDTLNNMDDNETNEGQKIAKLYYQIEKLSKNYYGTRDFVKEAKDLLDKYNDNIDSILKNNNSSIPEFNLSNEVLDVDFLYNKITNDLNNLLNELNEYFEKYKNYIKMLEYTRKCISILYREDNDVSETLFNDLIQIRDIVIPYIKNDSILIAIREIFISYENSLTHYLKGNEVNKVSNLKSLEDLKKEIALQMTPYLVELDNKVRNIDILNDIAERYKSLFRTIQKQNRNKHIMFWFDEIEKCIKEIKINGNDDDRDRLNQLLRDNNFISVNVNVSINKVYVLYMKVYRILIDINDRKNLNAKNSRFKVNI